MPPKRKVAPTPDLLEAIRRANQTLDEDEFYFPQAPPSWRPNQGFQPAGNPTFIVPAPYIPNANQINPYAPASASILNPYASASNTAISSAINPQTILDRVAGEPPMKKVDMGAEEAEEEIPQASTNPEVVAEDKPTEEDPFAEMGDLDLSEFDDFGTGRLFGNGVSGRRRRNLRRGYFY